MYEIEQIKKNLIARGATDLDSGDDGGRGVLKYRCTELRFQYSWGLGWEHVSISCKDRCPTWNEMCFFKDIFWGPTEWCVQYHPADSDYVNLSKTCLHIFKPTEVELPKPMVCMI